MKKIINNAIVTILITLLAVSSTGTAFAQFGYEGLNNTVFTDVGANNNALYDYYVAPTFVDYNLNTPGNYDNLYGGASIPNPGYSYVDYNLNTPGNYDNLNSTYFSDAATYYTSPTCVGCDTASNPGYSYVDYDLNTPGNYDNLNNTFFSDAATYYGNTTCVGCDTSYTPTYTAPTYTTPTYNYTAPAYTTPTYNYTAPTYTAPTYTTPTYTTPTYTQPTYTTPTYTYPTYNYTTPTYTTPTYTTPTYTTPTYTTPTYTTPTYNTTVCSDGQAPVNGSCVRTTTIPVTTNTVCADGFAPVNGSCVRTNTLPVTTTTRCADGTFPNPLTGCARTTTIPVTTSTLCADGTAPSPIVGCSRTTTIPVTTNTVCTDGQLPVNGSCVRTNVIPTQTHTICSDGSYPVNGSCIRTIPAPTVTYQSCWDGSTIPLWSVCPAQYKTCTNGTSIPVNQTCYYNPVVPYTPPQEIKFNNVITSVATEITKTSARCNGIGLIASGALSTGWFEYGETSNLGRETAHANIGSAPTAPFSNVLANLKPSTTYYCRAVMQNQYGTVKGEIVAFRTKATAVTYVKPVVTKTTTKVTKTTNYKASAAPKNEVVCVDGSVVKLESKTAAQLLNSGQKLITLQIEKAGGNLSAGSAVSYKLTFKNMSDEALRGVTVKVTVPQEITLTNASAGTYDPITHVITINPSVLAAYSEDSVTWTGVVAKDAQTGKSLATTAYSSYSLPGTNVQDEVTAYTVGSVVPGDAIAASSTGAKKVVGAATTDRGFLPNTLVEWLALIAIIFIIVVLGRSVYTSYSNDKKTVIHH